ncbi:MAG: flagellar filament protein FlaA [Spirochaetales bacterium]|nr:flagellar filament protein FlaA [Spirochaetales bacterium]
MKKILFILIITVIAVSGLFAQLNNVGEPDPTRIGVDTSQQMLQEISLSKFEDAGMWRAVMPRDFGVAATRKILGGPLDKEAIEAEVEAGIDEADDYVLGVKAYYYKRAMSHISIMPARPIPIEGICKTISLWVVGRNYEHVLKIMLTDYYGNSAELTIGKLNFSGWKKLTVAIPPSLAQKDVHYNNNMGIQIEGFRIECDPKDTLGTYYIYLDDMRAYTDLFSENNRDPDDIQDVW